MTVRSLYRDLAEAWNWPEPWPDHTGTVTDLFDDRTCRTCGCTDTSACDGGCWWAEPDLCSTCHRRHTNRVRAAIAAALIAAAAIAVAAH